MSASVVTVVFVFVFVLLFASSFYCPHIVDDADTATSSSPFFSKDPEYEYEYDKCDDEEVKVTDVAAAKKKK